MESNEGGTPGMRSRSQAVGGIARLRRHPRLIGLVLGLALGAVVGLYVRRWWAGGLFTPTSVVMAVALVALGVAVIACIIVAARTHSQARRQAASALGLALVVGAGAGVALGPTYQPAGHFVGVVDVHVTTPVTAEWHGEGFCWTDANSDEIGGLYLGTWTGPGSPTEGTFGFTTDRGAPALHFGTEGNYYDFFWKPPAVTTVVQVAPMRRSGDVAFTGMLPRGPGLLDAAPGQALDGHVTWSCGDTSNP